MTRRTLATRGERARAAAAAIAVNLFLGVAFVTGLALREERRGTDSLETFDVTVQPPPPAKIERTREEADHEAEGAQRRKAEASPVLATPTPIPRPSPVVAAPVPASGTGSSSGNAGRGTGPGSGGSGRGSGGGGAEAIGSEARLLGGTRALLPRALLRNIPQDRGYAHLLLTVSPAGSVSGCDVLTTTGFPTIDQALCGIMIRDSRWQAARDRAGRPITVKLRYTATWSKD